jgi:Asp-tRNA(Asn)/Glu-tRNA(Gln) amidotransferase A subunit family amidase
VFQLQTRINAYRRELRRWISAFDVVVCPVAAHPAPPHGFTGTGTVESVYRALNYTRPYSIGGLPAVSIPAGTEDGLPIGVQVVAPAWREDLAIAAAAAIEEELGGFRMFMRGDDNQSGHGGS